MNIYQVTSKDTSLARSTDFLVEVFVEFQNRKGIEVATDPRDADYLILHEVQAVAKSNYISEVLKCPFVSKYHHKILVVNWADNANGILRGLYTGLCQSRYNRYRHRVMPYFTYPNSKVLHSNYVNTSPKYLASFRGNLKSHPVRKALFNMYSQSDEIFYNSTDSWFDHSDNEQQSYVDLILDSKFALCPRGYAATSYRVQEVMALGRCPVIIADDYPLHVELYNPWKNAIQIKEKEINQLPQILKSAESEWSQRGEACKQEWQRISTEFVYQRHVDIFIEMMQTFKPLSHNESLKYLNSNLFRKEAGIDLLSRIKYKLNSLLR